MEALLNHLSPDVIIALLPWIAAELLRATDKTRANSPLHLLGILAQDALQVLTRSALTASSGADPAIQAEVERQLEARMAEIMKSVSSAAKEPNTINP